MGGKRVNWILAENDYVQSDMRHIDVAKRHSCSLRVVTSQSVKNSWRIKREAFRKEKLQLLHEKTVNNAANEDWKDRKKRIDKLKQVVDKCLAEVLSDAVPTKSKEGLMSSIARVSEHIELLEGNPTDRVDITESEIKERLSRIRNRLVTSIN